MTTRKTQESILAEKCQHILQCDTARVSYIGGKYFLIMGTFRNTKDDEGQWFDDKGPIDFDYTFEQCVASGKTQKELIESTKEYKRLSKLSTEEYLKEMGITWSIANKQLDV